MSFADLDTHKIENSDKNSKGCGAWELKSESSHAGAHEAGNQSLLSDPT